jgi:hypothetical protein
VQDVPAKPVRRVDCAADVATRMPIAVMQTVCRMRDTRMQHLYTLECICKSIVAYWPYLALVSACTFH